MNPTLKRLFLPTVAMMGFELAALTAVIQIWLSLSAGHYVGLSLGDILQHLGVAPPPAEWMNGSVYDMLWNEPLALISLLIGLVAATYAGIERFEESRLQPAIARP